MRSPLALLFFLSFAILETEGCHVGWIQFQDKCYFFSHTAATWFDAGSTCLLFHAKLAEPRSYDEINFLRSHSQSLNRHMWIGVSDIIEEGRFVYTSTQEVVQYTDFEPGEPGGHLSQNCVILWNDFHGKWADFYCASSLYYVCEEIVTSYPGNVIG